MHLSFTPKYYYDKLKHEKYNIEIYIDTVGAPKHKTNRYDSKNIDSNCKLP